MDDPWRTTVSIVVVVLAVEMVVRRRERYMARTAAGRPVPASTPPPTTPPPTTPRRNESAVKPWMMAGLAGWSALVIGVAIFTHLVPDARICDRSTVETSTDTETTTNCAGLGVTQAALLLAPGLLFLAPALTNLDIAGLFSLSFREVQKKLDEQSEVVRTVADDVAEIRTTQQTIIDLGLTVNVNQTVGQLLREGEQQVREGETISITDFVDANIANSGTNVNTGNGGSDETPPAS